MLPNRFAFGALAAACIAAAAAGGYVATRQNATPAVLQAEAPPPAGAAPVAATAAAVSTEKATTARPPDRTEAKTDAGTDAPPDSTAPEAAPAAPAAPVRTIAAPPARPIPAAPARRNEATARTVGQPSKSASTGIPSQDAPPPPPVDRPVANASTATMPPPLPSSPTTSPYAMTPPAPYTEDHATLDPPSAPEPPAKIFDELVVSADSVIGLQTESTISSERARVEDRVEAHVSRDVRVGGKVAILSGTRAIGSVTQVERGGKFKERAHLGIRFHTLVLADGTQLAISTETIIRDGDAPASAQKIGGGAVAGAILGAILGGSKGAAIGGAAGAGAGAAASAAGERNVAMLFAGEPITVRMLSPVTVTTEQ